ncbi:1-acylglycerol-3-phosphate O-acyltransferase [Mortierella sp. AD011]|nr:1-acylglycerol-3-phosphate O-acyltransferase [Mortierella sp. AD011]
MGMSVVGCFISIICAMLGKRSLSTYLTLRLFSRLAATPCGLKFNVKGEERLKNSPAIVVCNHQSNVDMIPIGRVFPANCAVMGKKELLYVPFLNLFDRQNHQSAIQTTAQTIFEMKKTNSGLWIFPEGTRSHSTKPGLLPFKKGAFHLAIQAQYPILPIVVEPYSHIYSSKKQHFPGGEIEIRVLEPIPTEGLTLKDVNGLMEHTRSIMLKNLHEMAGVAPPLPPLPEPPKIEASTEEIRPRL